MKTFITSPHDYSHIEEVPVQLQNAIKFAHSTGVPLDALAIIYDMPQRWIELFVLDAGQTKN